MLVFGVPRSFRLGDAATPLTATVPDSEVALPDPTVPVPIVNIEKQNDLLTFLSLASSVLMILRSL